MLELGGEDRLRFVDEEERCFSGGLCRGSADAPQHILELIDPSLSTGLELVAAPRLEPLIHLGVGAFGLAIASRVRHRGIADLRAEAGAV